MDKKTGCLIIHGFGGSAREVAPLAEYLSEKGFIIFCPQLKGHTGKRKDLGRTNFSEWIKSAEDGLKILLAQCQKVVIVGFSMGGLIAVNLAMKYRPAGVITLNAPVYYWNKKKIFENIVKDFKGMRFEFVRRYVKASFHSPVSALVNFRILLKKTIPLIKNISCPVLIAQGLEDDTVHPRSAEYIYNNVGSRKKVIKYYESSGHLICLGPDCNKLFYNIEEFMGSIIFEE